MSGQNRIAPPPAKVEGIHGVTGVMAARLVWDQEERFKSELFHHLCGGGKDA